MGIESKRKSLVNRWFQDILAGNRNSDILLLEESVIDRVEILLKKHGYPKSIYRVIYDVDSIRKTYELNNKNIILILQTSQHLKFIENLNLLNRSFLFVPHKSEFYSNIEDYISPKERLDFTSIHTLKKNRYLFYIEKIDPFSLIKDSTVSEIIAFLEFVLTEGYLSWYLQNSYQVVTEKTSFNIDNLMNRLSADLALLENSQILTSRLGVVIYRVAMLNPKATITAVGRYFHKSIGSKSKTLNYNLIKLYKTTQAIDIDKTLVGKNFKAYDLNINESEIVIRMEIAKKLLSLNPSNLSNEKIAEVTKLPLEEVKKLSKK